jgi:hypothetical protein
LIQQCDLDEQQGDVANLLQAYAAPPLQALTDYAYLIEAIHVLGS